MRFRIAQLRPILEDELERQHLPWTCSEEDGKLALRPVLEELEQLPPASSSPQAVLEFVRGELIHVHIRPFVEPALHQRPRVWVLLQRVLSDFPLKDLLQIVPDVGTASKGHDTNHARSDEMVGEEGIHIDATRLALEGTFQLEPNEVNSYVDNVIDRAESMFGNGPVRQADLSNAGTFRDARAPASVPAALANSRRDIPGRDNAYYRLCQLCLENARGDPEFADALHRSRLLWSDAVPLLLSLNIEDLRRRRHVVDPGGLLEECASVQGDVGTRADDGRPLLRADDGRPLSRHLAAARLHFALDYAQHQAELTTQSREHRDEYESMEGGPVQRSRALAATTADAQPSNGTVAYAQSSDAISLVRREFVLNDLKTALERWEEIHSNYLLNDELESFPCKPIIDYAADSVNQVDEVGEPAKVAIEGALCMIRWVLAKALAPELHCRCIERFHWLRSSRKGQSSPSIEGSIMQLGQSDRLWNALANGKSMQDLLCALVEPELHAVESWLKPLVQNPPPWALEDIMALASTAQARAAAEASAATARAASSEAAASELAHALEEGPQESISGIVANGRVTRNMARATNWSGGRV